MKFRKSYMMSVLFVTLAIAGCGAKGSDSESPSPSSSATPAPTESSSAAPSETPKVTILQQFKDQTLAGLPANELFASFKQMIEETEPAVADEFIRTLEAYYEKNLPKAEKKYEADNVQQELAALEWPITEEQIQVIKDDSVRDLANQTLEGGYKLVTAEGFIFPIIDYGKLLSFGDKVTTAMKAYLNVMATESDAASASDGGLIITWDELASRTLAAESYVVTFPDSPERTKIENRYMNYLSMYLIGLNNTPIFDFETFVLLPEVKSQYEQMAASHAGTITGQLTMEMLGVVNESKGSVFVKGKNGEQEDIPAMKQFRDKIESAARSKLPAGKK